MPCSLWLCHVAYVFVAYALFPTFCNLVISGVSRSCCLWLWIVPPASLCVGSPGRPVLSGRNLGMESWGTDRNQKDPVPGWSLVPVSWWLWEGPSWARSLKRSDGLTCACILSIIQKRKIVNFLNYSNETMNFVPHILNGISANQDTYSII